MEHRHTHARNALKPALIVTATFLVAEFIGALYTNSLALLADSGHMLTENWQRVGHPPFNFLTS